MSSTLKKLFGALVILAATMVLVGQLYADPAPTGPIPPPPPPVPELPW